MRNVLKRIYNYLRQFCDFLYMVDFVLNILSELETLTNLETLTSYTC